MIICRRQRRRIKRC